MNIKLTEREIDIINQYKQAVYILTNGEINLPFRKALSQMLEEMKAKLEESKNND